jgi:hypothetical protein
MIAVPFGGSVFPSRRDFWIVALIWFGAAMALFGGFAQFSSDASAWLRILILLALVALASLMLWILYGTHYSFTEDSLLVVSGPFHFRVPLSEIEGVRPSRIPFSSPACSLDRLLIEWRGGRRRILISPRAKSDFLVELDERCPRLSLEGDRLVS